MSSMTLRNARPDDHARLVAIDDASATLFEQAGLSFAHLTPQHPFVLGEYARWRAELAAGGGYIAVLEGEDAGFALLGSLDGAPYLDQLSVVPASMRRGVGSALIAHAVSLSQSAGCLWLTTYGHLPWNRAYYERHGFRTVEEARCGPELRAVLDAQRAALPQPEQRIAMRKAWPR